MRNHIKKVALALFAGFMGAALLASQAKKQPSATVPQYDAAAVIKLVTVRVLNQEGQPVTHLQKENFVLYDNGEKKEITEFEKHTISEEGMLIRSTDEAAELAGGTEGMNRRLFILLDIQGSDINGIVNAKKAALHFVENQLRRGDEVGILGFSPMAGFFIQEYLTTDFEKIKKAIEKAKEVRGSQGFVSGGAGDDSIGGPPGREVPEGEGGASQVMSYFGAGSSAVAVPGSGKNQRTDFVPRMIDLAEALKSIPGNKSLILFSSRNLGPMAVRLGQAFAGASTPVYAVNTQNWITQGYFTAVRKKHVFTEHPLKELSLASGGKYFADIDDRETISRDMQALTGNFYVLGYYVTETWDGAYHKIKIEVKDPELEVLSQDGYFNPKPFASLTDFEKKLHLLDLAFTEKATSFVRLNAPVEPLYLVNHKEANCAFLTRMTVDEKTGIPPGRVEIYALLFDKEQNPVLMKRGELDCTPYNQQTLFPYLMSHLKAGEYECRIVARDIQTGQALVGNTAFSLPTPVDSDILFSSPLLFAPGPESLVLRLSEDTNKRQKAKVPSLSELYRSFPRNHSLVIREIGPGIKNLLAVIPTEVTEGTTPEVDFFVQLKPKEEAEPYLLTSEVVGIKKAGASRYILMMEIELPELKPGEYELEIEAIETSTQASYYVRKSLVVK